MLTTLSEDVTLFETFIFSFVPALAVLAQENEYYSDYEEYDNYDDLSGSNGTENGKTSDYYYYSLIFLSLARYMQMHVY